MTVNTNLLREAITFLRANPSNYDQTMPYYKGVGCVIGRAAIIAGAELTSNSSEIKVFPGGFHTPKGFAMGYLGLAEEDYYHLFSTVRTLSEIDRRVTEIEDIQRVIPAVVGEVTLKVNDNIFKMTPTEADAFVRGVRAVDSDIRIVKITEEEL